ncbi:hypothetical protein U1701_17580 [Sphingomonas sp. PB2P19]|uniref:hypothetical protein n=1 Tax=Sphingomonas rhamnosi TaxID=3096156 RepID=UPI002FCAE2FD
MNAPMLSARQRRLIKRDDFWTAHFGQVLFTVLALVGASIAILGWQGAEWLKSGQWPDLTWRDALGWLGIVVPQPSWVGFARIVGWIMSLPFALAPFLLAGLILWVLLRGENDPDLKTARHIIARSKTKPAF